MSRLILIFILMGTCQSLLGQTKPYAPHWGDWQTWGDAGNGTYTNPVITADYSDIDCIRVGSSYYAVSSTFQFSPGFIVLCSKDLVNWKILSHVVDDITRISSELSWKKMNRYGRGIWAGAIRYNHNKFWIYFGTPDEGYFMSTAKNAWGPWEPVHKVMPRSGWDDCCPFWDDDGQGYLVGTSFKEGYKIHLLKMTGDGKELMKGWDKVIYQGEGSEANKLYKIKGVYYHLFSEVKADGRALMMERSRSVAGPYSAPKQLSVAQKQFNEPNQGGLVQSQNGKWYFLTHHGTGDWSGRVVSLLPVTWIKGWPIIGKVGPGDVGQMVWSGKLPEKTTHAFSIQSSDEFNNYKLLPQWEWNYQPRADKWSLNERKGWLRLHAFRPLEKDNLLKVGNTLTQRSFRTKFNEVITRLDVSGMADGQKAGLAHFGSPEFGTIGIACYRTHKKIEFKTPTELVEGPEITSKFVWLKSTWGLAGKSSFYFSTNGNTYTPFGNSYQLLWQSYRGDRVAIFNYNNRADTGYIDVDFFHYRYAKN